MSIKGFRSLQRLQTKLAGYTESQSIDDALYATVQKINGKRGALDTIIHGGYKLTGSPLTAAAGSNIRTIICAGHPAIAGDYLNFGVNSIEANVLSIPDANTIIIAHELTFDPTGLTFDVYRHVTPSYNQDGSLNVVAAASPGASTSAKQDTGNTSLASIDTKVSTSNTSLSSIDSKLTSQATAANQTTEITKLTSIDGKIPALGQALSAASTPVVLPATQITALTPPAAITGFNLEATQLLIKAKTDNLDVALSTVSKEVTQLAMSAKLPAVLGSTASASSLSVGLSTEDIARQGIITETAPVSDTASSGINGRLQRIAQRLTSLIALFPTALGQGTMAQSMKVVIASDQAAIPVTPGIISGTPTSSQAAVGLSAVRATVAGTAPNAARKKLSIKPSTANTGKIYYGGASVTIANGLEIIGPDRLDFDKDASDYWLISDTAAQVVEIVEVV